MLTLLMLLACGQPESEPYVPKPPLILNGRNIPETLKPNQTEYLEFHNCPLETIIESLGLPRYYGDDDSMRWENFGPRYTLVVRPKPYTIGGCVVRIDTWK